LLLNYINTSANCNPYSALENLLQPQCTVKYDILLCVQPSS